MRLLPYNVAPLGIKCSCTKKWPAAAKTLLSRTQLVAPLMYASAVPSNQCKGLRAILLHDCIHWVQCDPRTFNYGTSTYFYSPFKTRRTNHLNNKIYAKFWPLAVAAYHSEHLSWDGTGGRALAPLWPLTGPGRRRRQSEYQNRQMRKREVLRCSVEIIWLWLSGLCWALKSLGQKYAK